VCSTECAAASLSHYLNRIDTERGVMAGRKQDLALAGQYWQNWESYEVCPKKSVDLSIGAFLK